MMNSSKDAEDLRIYQIIDANLDRAREGLRVLEYEQICPGKEKYVEKIKNFRQIVENHLKFINNLEITLRTNVKIDSSRANQQKNF